MVDVMVGCRVRTLVSKPGMSKKLPEMTQGRNLKRKHSTKNSTCDTKIFSISIF